MSAKNLDRHYRWRSKTIAFRMSEEENEQLNIAVKLSGLSKQDYLISKALCRDVVVHGNPRVFKALRNQFSDVLNELQRIEAGTSVDDELLETIQMITAIMAGLKEEDTYRN